MKKLAVLLIAGLLTSCGAPSANIVGTWTDVQTGVSNGWASKDVARLRFHADKRGSMEDIVQEGVAPNSPQLSKPAVEQRYVGFWSVRHGDVLVLDMGGGADVLFTIGKDGKTLTDQSTKRVYHKVSR